MRGGWERCSLPAGYLGSSFYGALFIFTGFDLLASKVMACILGVILLLVLFVAKDWLLRGLTVLFILLIPLLWWLPVTGDVNDFDGHALRFFVLFCGAMSGLYSLWDIIDDLIKRSVKESDATRFSQLCPICSPRAWGVIWLIESVIMVALGIVAGVYAF